MEVRLDRRSVFLGDQGRSLEPVRPTVLFIHGAGMDHSVWPLQARHFAYRGWNALALDLPGHGRSAPLGDDGALLASVPAMAAWLVQVIDVLGIARAHLVGHSMGALVALEAAAAHDDRVQSIALLGAT
ncbi:MAG TPA: alpha/beta fold hydrolase, partial [Geminicoccaceae bacterium]